VATNPRKRQQKLEKRAAKRKEKKHLIVREQQAGLADRIAAAARHPILDAWIMDGVWTQGLGQVLLSREMPDGSVAIAVFLVDRYCLGVKDAMARFLPRSRYDDDFVRRTRATFGTENATPAKVRKLVEDAVAYAEGLGLHPHADHHKAAPLFGSIDRNECTETFEFGKDGKPFFVSGPHDTPERCRRILATLVEHCGPDGFHYMIKVDDPDRYLPPSLKGTGNLVPLSDEEHLLDPDSAFEDEP
jgi:hypothetical protein